MDDRELETLLRRYRPADPAAELRARILAPHSAGRAWPWVAAAAALLALTIGLHESAGRMYATLPRAADAAALRRDLYPALREVATDDEIAMLDMMSALERADDERRRVTVWP